MKHLKLYMQNITCGKLSLCFLQCPVPVWPDSVHGQPQVPASHPSMALGAAHTPTSCSVAVHSHTAHRRSVDAHTLTFLWRLPPTVTRIRAYQSPLKWHAKGHYVLRPMHISQIIPHYNYPTWSYIVVLPTSALFSLSGPFICTISTN